MLYIVVSEAVHEASAGTCASRGHGTVAGDNTLVVVICPKAQPVYVSSNSDKNVQMDYSETNDVGTPYRFIVMDDLSTLFSTQVPSYLSSSINVPYLLSLPWQLY